MVKRLNMAEVASEGYEAGANLDLKQEANSKTQMSPDRMPTPLSLYQQGLSTGTLGTIVQHLCRHRAGSA